MEFRELRQHAFFMAANGSVDRNLKLQKARFFIHKDLTRRAYNRNQFFLWGVGL